MTQIIDKISCIGFRGFETEQTLSLAIPNGKPGSGLTVMIGPNSGGKSTLIESFRKLVLNKTSFTEGKRNKVAGDKVCITIEIDGKQGRLKTVPQGGAQAEWISKDKIERPQVFFPAITSRI